MMRLQGKVALVTGGGTGIGAAVVKRFVEEGAKVCITGRRREKLEAMAASLPAGSVVMATGSCSNEDDSKRMVETALGINGRLDILVNNAAIEVNAPLVDMEPTVWREMLENNITGPFFMMKAAIPAMAAAGGGSIINVASLAAVRAVPGAPAYCASKAAVIHLTKQVALDYGKDNIRCNVVCPGPVRTSMLEMNLEPLAEALETDMDGAFAQLGGHVPIGFVAQPDDMGGVFTYLASDDSRFMTGSTLMIDGGVHIVDSFAAGVGLMGGDWG
jgi:meso-butanediol dehydrogenase/(S,S)-butanediol dehydrogenase/diacetyl reductase